MAKAKDKRKRNLEKGITQRADGRYCYRKSVQGQKPICIYARTLEEIRKKIVELENPVPQKRIDTLDEVANAFFQEKFNIRETTKEQYKKTYSTRISPYIGKKKVADLRSSDFKQLFINLFIAGLKQTTIQYVKIIALEIIKYADENDMNSPDIVRVGWSAFLRGQEKQEKKKVRSLTSKEQEAFQRYIRENDRYFRIVPIVEVLLSTGMRIGECLALTWDDLDFENKTIKIDKSLAYYKANGGKHVFKMNPPKTDAGKRVIPMFDSYDVFLYMKDNELFPPCDAVVDGYTNFIFSTENNNPYIATNLTSKMKEIVKRYNTEEIEKAEKENRKPLQIEPFSLHCLRHTFATNACRYTADYKSVQEIMGHKSVLVTLDIYADAKEEGKTELMRLLEGKLLL